MYVYTKFLENCVMSKNNINIKDLNVVLDCLNEHSEQHQLSSFCK